MIHTFDTDVAKEYGVNCAIILQNLYYWVEKNRANERHFYDGRYWTYNSVKAFEELFPYLSGKQIRSALNKLVDEGIIVDGYYNDSAYDRTKWYAITEKGMCFFQKRQMDLPSEANGNPEKGKCINIYNNNISSETDNKPNNNLIDSNESICQTTDVVRQAVAEWNTLAAYGIEPVKRIAPSSKRYKMMNARISEYGIDEVIRTIRMVKDCDFLLGRTHHGFVVDFEWFARPNNFPKINEGKYLNRDAVGKYDNKVNDTSLDEFADYE